MSVALYEQETTISFYRDSDNAHIYTSDTTVMTRLDKLVKNPNCPDWKLVEIQRSRDGEIVGKCYQTHKKLASSFRGAIVERNMTEEQREEMRLRASKMQQVRREKQNAVQLQNNDDET